MISKIFFMPMDYAERFKPDSDSIIISITEPGSPIAVFAGNYIATKRVSFQDYTVDDERGTAPKPIHAQQIVEFVTENHTDPRVLTLVIHCKAGRSRSAAVAKWAHEHLGVPARGKPADIGFRLANSLLLDLLKSAATQK